MNTFDNNIMDWDSAIESDGSQFIVLPEGDYAFTVTGFERGRYPGSAKLPPCNKASLTLTVELPDGQTATCKEDLMVYRDGDRIRPNPYIAISRAAFAEVKSLAAEFGLTPANRTAIIANALTVEKSKKELDPMEQILTSTSLDDVIIVEEVNADEEETGEVPV